MSVRMCVSLLYFWILMKVHRSNQNVYKSLLIKAGFANWINALKFRLRVQCCCYCLSGTAASRWVFLTNRRITISTYKEIGLGGSLEMLTALGFNVHAKIISFEGFNVLVVHWPQISQYVLYLFWLLYLKLSNRQGL